MPRKREPRRISFVGWFRNTPCYTNREIRLFAPLYLSCRFPFLCLFTRHTGRILIIARWNPMIRSQYAMSTPLTINEKIPSLWGFTESVFVSLILLPLQIRNPVCEDKILRHTLKGIELRCGACVYSWQFQRHIPPRPRQCFLNAPLRN